MTKMGKLLYDICYKASMFLGKHKWLYYTLSFTWGIIGTLLGGLVLLIYAMIGQNLATYNGHLMVFIGNNWGGLELGCGFLVARYMGTEYTMHTIMHECGHNYQNAILGPFVIFLCFIPGAIRYWYRLIGTKHGKEFKTPYDGIWFEASATDIGTALYGKEQ